jgi:6-phosphogluconolactonase (cycloisomerase 2 family)
MKFSKMSQLFLVSSIGLIVATLLTACEITTIDFVYVASSSGVEIYAVDSESGALRTGDPTITTGISAPVALATTSDYTNLYVANAGINTIVHFTIGINGDLTSKDTVTLSGTPVSMAVNQAGTYLYVISCTSAAQTTPVNCVSSGMLTEYALSSGAIGSEVAQAAISFSGYANLSSYASDVLIPTGITVLANNGSTIIGNAVYVSAFDQTAYNPGCTPTPACTPSSANPGWVFGFTIGSGGALSPTANSPYKAGVKPSAIASDPTDRYVYVTDYASNQLIGYTILDLGTLNTLSFLPNGPFKTGNEPISLVIDPRGQFIYIANALDNSVSAYEIVLANGTPSAAVATSGTFTNLTDTQPVDIIVDPALGRFVYTANYLGNSVSGFLMNTTAGTLAATQATPYPTGDKPTALVGIPHGNHSTQAVNP